MSRSFPVALKLEGRACLVVGSSSEAAARVATLCDCGAQVRVVAEHASSELLEVTRARGIPLLARAYTESDLDGVWLAVLADQDVALAALVDRHAAARRVLFCVVDMPQHGSFSHLALARSGFLSVAIGTEGEAPALARRLRQELQRLMDAADLETFAEQLAKLRRETPSEQRKTLLNEAVAGVLFEGCLRLPRLQ